MQSYSLFVSLFWKINYNVALLKSCCIELSSYCFCLYNPWQKEMTKVNYWHEITLLPPPPWSVLNSQIFVMLFVFFNSQHWYRGMGWHFWPPIVSPIDLSLKVAGLSSSGKVIRRDSRPLKKLKINKWLCEQLFKHSVQCSRR